MTRVVPRPINTTRTAAKLTRDGVIIAQLCARGEKEQGALPRQLRLFATTAACIHPCRPRSNTGNPLPAEIWQGAGWAIHLVGETFWPARCLQHCSYHTMTTKEYHSERRTMGSTLEFDRERKYLYLVLVGKMIAQQQQP